MSVSDVTSTGSGRQCFRLVQSQHAVAEQRSPRRSSAGCQSRVPGQTEAGGSTASPDESHACCRHHPGENIFFPKESWTAATRLNVKRTSNLKIYNISYKQQTQTKSG